MIIDFNKPLKKIRASLRNTNLFMELELYKVTDNLYYKTVNEIYKTIDQLDNIEEIKEIKRPSYDPAYSIEGIKFSITLFDDIEEIKNSISPEDIDYGTACENWFVNKIKQIKQWERKCKEVKKPIEGKPYIVIDEYCDEHRRYYAGLKDGKDWFWNYRCTKYTIFHDRTASFPEDIDYCTSWDNWQEIEGVDYE